MSFATPRHLAPDVIQTPSSRPSIALLQGILNACHGYVAYFEPIREPNNSSEQGCITDFVFQVINNRVCELIGQPIDRIIGHYMTDYFPGAKGNGLFDRYAAVVETGKADTFEFPYAADGYDGWYLITAQPLATGFVLSFIDITDRKKAELIAHQQAERIQATLDASLNSILLLRAIRDKANTIIDFRMEAANQAVRNSLFRGPEELIGQRMLEVFPGNVESGFFDLYARVTDTGHSERAEYYYQDTNDFTGWFEVSAVRQETDLTVLTFNNVSSYRQAQLIQQRQAEVLQVILDHSQTAISLHEAIRDATGRIIDFRAVQANQQALANWGALSETMLSQSFLTIRPDARDSDEFARYVRVVETGLSETFEFSYADRQYTINIAKTDGGVVMSAVDVTADRDYLHKLEAINQNLQQSNENLQSFAYVASHDLQEPLRKIQQFGDVIRNRYAGQLGAEGADLINRMQGAAERMSTLIRDLLALSRISTQQQPFAPVNLTNLLTEVLSDLETVVQEQHAQITIGDLCDLYGDASQFRQLVQNLLSNALKFAKSGHPPHIYISCHVATDTELPRALAGAGQFNCLSVTDNGIGFDSQLHGERVFGTFQRLQGRGQYAGTGIGLAVVKKVAERHGGTVAVESKPNEGATFRVFLPVLT